MIELIPSLSGRTQLRTDGVHYRESAGTGPLLVHIISLEVSRFPSIFLPLPFSLYGEYVVRFPLPDSMFSYLVTTDWIFDISLLLFLTFSVLVANPTKIIYTVANPARGLLNREERTKEKVWQRTTPPPRCSIM